MKVIQICGTNGTGKTTLVKGLLTSGKFLRMELPIDGEVKEWWYDGEVAVIGRYASNNCCGVDAGNYSGEKLIAVIERLINNHRPKVILYEGLIFCKLMSFSERVKEVAYNNGYQYLMITLIASLQTIHDRILKRSGNPNVNFDRMRSNQMLNIRNAKKMAADGVRVLLIDTEYKSAKETLRALKKLINE